MENDFLRFSPKRVLYSVVMASTLWVGSPQLVFSEVRDVQAILQSGFVKGQVVDEKSFQSMRSRGIFPDFCFLNTYF